MMDPSSTPSATNATAPVADNGSPTLRISADCPEETAQILRAAAAHDVARLKKLLDVPGKANLQDPTTRETPLHAAIRSAAEKTSPEQDAAAAAEATKATVSELFWSGAIWNDVDDADETPGCVARRLGLHELYNLCRDAGVRAEMLFALMDGYEALSSGSEDGDDDIVVMDTTTADADGEQQQQHNLEDGDEAPQLVDVVAATTAIEQEQAAMKEETEEDGDETRVGTHIEGDDLVVVESETYLNSNVTYSDGKLVDDDGNGVMMAWETDIMRRSVDALLPDQPPAGAATSAGGGKRILNIGFGMGIIDTMFASTGPARHHIIEAHPSVLTHAKTSPDSKFGPAWEASGPEPGAFKLHGGRWQEVCPQLLERGEVYDAIYFDTFGEDYGQLRAFFTEMLPGLLDAEGRFGFFNGLGADRQICYDVYTRVAEMHLADAGLDVDWTTVDVDMEGLGQAGKDGWEGVRRRYWTLDEYRLPVCTFLG